MLQRKLWDMMDRGREKIKQRRKKIKEYLKYCRKCKERRWEWRKLVRWRWKGEIIKGGWIEREEEWGSECQCQEQYQYKMHQTPSQGKRQALFSLLYYIIFSQSNSSECGLKTPTTSQKKRKKESMRSHWWSTREKDKSLKDCQLLWGTVSKSSRGRERWLEMCCVGGQVTAWTDEID